MLTVTVNIRMWGYTVAQNITNKQTPLSGPFISSDIINCVRDTALFKLLVGNTDIGRCQRRFIVVIKFVDTISYSRFVNLIQLNPLTADGTWEYHKYNVIPMRKQCKHRRQRVKRDISNTLTKSAGVGGYN